MSEYSPGRLRIWEKFRPGWLASSEITKQEFTPE